MASISRTLGRIKNDLQPFLSESSILAACRQAGHEWRERLFGPVQTIHLFILQVLSFNTAIVHLRHLAKLPVNASAYCQARMRLPLEVLQTLLRQSARALAPAGQDRSVWCGLRVLLVDGSSTIAPDTPQLQKAFGQPTGQKKGCGFAVPKLLGLFDAATGLILDLMAFPLFTNEISKVWMLHPLLGVGDLLVGDRGLCSYAHLALLAAAKAFGLFRIPDRKQIVSFRPHRKHGGKGQPKSRWIKRLGKHDQLVEWLKPSHKPKWMTRQQYASLPDSLLVREVRCRLPRKGQRTFCVTIVTTLLDPLAYPKEKILELYGVRWQVETHFAELKTTLKMRRIKCKTVKGVQKELAIYCLVYNLVHAVMLKAAQRQNVPPDRISFIDTVRWLASADPQEMMPDLVENPKRPDRHEPRVIKDLQDTYRKMTQPRSVLRRKPELTRR
jgi:hypothetical protein